MSGGLRGGASTPIVFISSTAEDLGRHRAAARDAVSTAELGPRMMEYFVAAGDKPPLAACLAKVADADLVVVIAAHRYGWIPPDQPGGADKSITWLECEEAVREGKEILASVVDEKASWSEELREEHEITVAIRQDRATPQLLADVQRRVARLRELKPWLGAGRIRAAFSSPEDLRAKVSEALHSWLRRHALPAHAVSAGAGDPTKYLGVLRGRSAYIDIRGLMVGSGRAPQFPIEDLYITLTTTSPPRESEKRTDAERRKQGSGKRFDGDVAAGMDGAGRAPLQNSLAHTRVVVVGEPGAGKSTFLRRVAYVLCRALLGEDPEAAHNVLGIGDRPFPILVKLDDLAKYIARDDRPGQPVSDESPAWLPRFLAAQSREERWGLDEAFFQRQLERGPSLVLLDGLDESPDRLTREAMAQLVERAADAYEKSRFVVTTRPAGYEGRVVLAGFARVEIGPLTGEAIATFIGRWCGALWMTAPSEAAAHKAELLSALAAPAIARLAMNAVMLTALAVVHWNQRRLPEQRADLYESVIIWLSRAREQRAGRANAAVCVTRLEELALAMHRHPQGRQVQVSRRWAAEAVAPLLTGVAETERVREAERFLDEEEIDSGIVLAAGDGLRFWHLTFQEYLAAKAIGGRADDAQAKLLLEPSEKGAPTKRLYAAEWREVVLLLGGVLRKQGPAKIDGLVKAILDDVGPALTDQARCVGLLGAMLRDLAPFGYTIADPRYATLSSTVAAIFDPAASRGVPVKLRIDAADALGQASDPRLDPENPDRWVTIPAGTFWMGAQSVRASERNYDGEAFENEAPVHEVTLDEFRIARYPVTVADYRRFVEDRGYAGEQWWKAGGFGRWQAPDGWPQQILFPSRPVVGVSWWEAMAYCAWAGCRLPTEAEWERAARGREARKFPWGGEPIDPEHANFGHNVGHPTPVGVYPHGRTPEGIDDLAGNVWEWCFDWFGPYEKGRGRNPTGVSKGGYRVLRGGSWFGADRFARSAFRFWFHPVNRYDFIGFRVVVVGGGARTPSDGCAPLQPARLIPARGEGRGRAGSHHQDVRPRSLGLRHVARSSPRMGDAAW